MDDSDDVAGDDLDDLKDALRDQLPRAASEEMARLHDEAAADDSEAAGILARLEKALARKQAGPPRRSWSRA
jgi:hypothetical protein